MNISDFKSSSHDRFEQYCSLLEHRYGLRIDWESPDDHLKYVYAHYMDKKKYLNEQSGADMGKLY